MTTAEVPLPDWVRRLPEWVRDSEIRWLTKRPWIAGFIYPNDYTLDRAVERFDQSQRRFGVGHHQQLAELLAVRGMETTSLRFGTAAGPGVTRAVTVTSPDATRFSGIAVPYEQPSTPVEVSGIVTLEQFDRHSLAPLPPSVPLRVGHDPDQLLGRVTSLRHTEAGLAVEASSQNGWPLQWIASWLRGEYSSLSIGFAGAAIFDDWSTSGGLPLRTVRRAQLVEVSVVPNPAYPSARIVEVR